MCRRQSLKTRSRRSRARLALLRDQGDAWAGAQAPLQREREHAGLRLLLARIAARGEIRAVAPQEHAAGVAEIVSIWFGQSEESLADVFVRASEHSRRIVNEFLTQLDGVLAQNRDVLVLAASNMPWDSAMKRSVRFARQVFVPPPDAAAREYLFRLKLDGVPSEAIGLPALARATPFYSGADIEGLIDLAKERVIAHALDTGDERPLHQRDLLEAVAEYPASTLEWLRTARNLVRYGGDGGYRELEQYLKVHKLL